MQETIKNILSLIVLVIYIIFGVRLALHWTFGDFADVMAYVGILTIVGFMAMVAIAGAQSAGTKERNPFC